VERQEAIRIDPEVTREEVARFRQTIEDRLGGAEKLAEELEQAGIDEKEFSRICEREAKVLKLRSTIFDEEIKEPSDAEIAAYYRDVAWPRWTDVRTRSIFVEAPLGAPLERQKKREEIEKLRVQAIEGADFAALARQYSEDENTRENGGDNGWATMSILPPYIRRPLHDLSPGGVTDVIEVNYPKGSEGFVIFKMTDVRRRDVKDPVVRQVLVAEIKDRKRQPLYRDWLIQKRNQSKIVIRDSKIRQILGV
jgi:parvulin-like peptidyl-prolyl isomerase